MKNIFNYIMLRRKYNKVVLERDTLELTIKDELYKIFMSKLDDAISVNKLQQEVHQLRSKLKEVTRDAKSKNHKI